MKRGILTLSSMIAGLLMGATVAFSQPGYHSRSASMSTAGLAKPPIGHVRFCGRFPDECAKRGEATIVNLDRARWTELLEANHKVNVAVAPVTDMEYYRTEEFWTLPEQYGDCEDYVLLKRRNLIEKGWPSGALLITVVFDENNEGHAILIARTDRGDFVLDNKIQTIEPWYATPYRYVKRQSGHDPRKWVSIDDRRHMEDGVASIR